MVSTQELNFVTIFFPSPASSRATEKPKKEKISWLEDGSTMLLQQRAEIKNYCTISYEQI